MELYYLKNNKDLIDNKINELFNTTNENIITINREFANHEIDKRYTNIMTPFMYKMNEIRNMYRDHKIDPETTVTYYTLVTQLLRIATIGINYLNKFVNLCNIPLGKTIYEYNRFKYNLLSKLLDKYEEQVNVIREFNPIENVGLSAYDFLDMETDFENDYSDITISFTCDLIRDDLIDLNVIEQITYIDEIENVLIKRLKKKQLKR